MTAETVAMDPATSVLTFLGCELRRLRLAAGWTQAELARKALSTQAMISYVETGKRIPSAELVRELDAVFETGGLFARLLPVVLAHAYGAWYVPFVEMEAEAVSIRAFDRLVPGPLQTEPYARAVLGATCPGTADDVLATRMARARIFGREAPPKAWFVLEEAALAPGLGDAQLMRAQCERILEVAALPSVVVQVLPSRVAVHPGLGGPFSVLAFDEGPQVLFADGFVVGRVGVRDEEVAHAADAFDLLRAMALSPEDSARLVAERVRAA